MPAPGPRSRGARVHPRPCQGFEPWPRTSAASGLRRPRRQSRHGLFWSAPTSRRLGLATQELGGITGRGTSCSTRSGMPSTSSSTGWRRSGGARSGSESSATSSGSWRSAEPGEASSRARIRRQESGGAQSSEPSSPVSASTRSFRRGAATRSESSSPSAASRAPLTPRSPRRSSS